MAVFSLLIAGLSGGMFGCSSDNRVPSVAPEERAALP